MKNQNAYLALIYDPSFKEKLHCTFAFMGYLSPKNTLKLIKFIDHELELKGPSMKQVNFDVVDWLGENDDVRVLKTKDWDAFVSFWGIRSYIENEGMIDPEVVQYPFTPHVTTPNKNQIFAPFSDLVLIEYGMVTHRWPLRDHYFGDLPQMMGGPITYVWDKP